MGFAPYEEVVPPIRLTYRGKTYELPPVSVTDHPRLLAALDVAAAAAAGDDVKRDDLLSDEEFDRILLGEAGTQMRADDVPPDLINRALRTATAEVRLGRQFAEMVWATDGQPAELQQWLLDRLPPEIAQALQEATTATSPAEETAGT